ncbi:MAG: glutamine-hydrolyzing GMP synthase [Candidatus Woesearchaeota archaeon]
MEKILVLDFGGQYTQLIARIVRNCNVYSEIVDCEADLSMILSQKPKGIILSGGPDSVYAKGAPSIDKRLLSAGVPVLGICYGMQLIAHLLEGKVVNGLGEFGQTKVELDTFHPLFFGLPKENNVWMSHGDSVIELPKDFKVIGRTRHHTAAIASETRKIFGVQFHPEVSHTVIGTDIVSNFVHKICGCAYDWTMASFVEEAKQYVRDTVHQDDIICFVSGGVDSSFVALLLSKTEGIGNVYPVYIEALMRKNETAEVVNALKSAGIKNLIVKKAEDRFISALHGVTEPEQKRKIIGNLFGQIQAEVIKELKLDPEHTFLAQGTLYTDLIESGLGVGKRAERIKSHHNVGCEFIEELKAKGRVVEPCRLIFKDEVRLAGKEIGLPKEIFERQPFPGPGLAIRIVDGNSSWIDDSFNVADSKVKEIASEFGLAGCLLPIKIVGVQGDARTYCFLALLSGAKDWKNIRLAAEKIPKHVRLVNRVVYILGDQPSHPEMVIPTTITRETVDQLKDIDFDVRKIIDSCGFSDKISQTIVILFASDLFGAAKRTVCLRAVNTPTFMTVSPVAPDEISMSWKCLEEINSVLLKKHSVGAFVIDVTDKPPATTCWE